jgi:hypothetical protein
MLVFRSLAVGLSAAFFALLVMRPSVVYVHVPVIDTPVVEAPRLAPPTIVDVAPGVSLDQLPFVLTLAPDERITSVDSLELARLDRHRNQFVDLTVSGAAGERRVLVLLH